MKDKGLQLNLADMFEQHAVFDIPPNNDAPAIKLFTKQEIAHLNEVLDRVEIDEGKTGFENADFDEVQEMLMNLRDSFRTCKEKNVEMVLFAH